LFRALPHFKLGLGRHGDEIEIVMKTEIVREMYMKMVETEIGEGS
jgi:hypothetical protein